MSTYPGGAAKATAAAELVLAVLLVPLASVAASYIVAMLPGPAPFSAVLFVQGVLVLAGVVALCGGRLSALPAMGLTRPRARDIGRGLKLLLAVFAVNIVFRALLWLVQPDAVVAQMERLVDVGGLVVGGVTPVLVVALSLFIGFYEELLARGVILQRAMRLLPGAALPVAVSSLLFGLGHLYQGAIGVVQTALVGAVFAVGVLRWQSLWPAILAHGLLNAISLLMLTSV